MKFKIEGLSIMSKITRLWFHSIHSLRSRPTSTSTTVLILSTSLDDIVHSEQHAGGLIKQAPDLDNEIPQQREILTSTAVLRVWI